MLRSWSIGQSLFFVLATSALSAFPAHAIAGPSPSSTVIPPVVLQGCAEKVRPGHRHAFANRYGFGDNETESSVVGFDVSFVNTTDQPAKLVMLRIGGTDFAKIGTFSPGVAISWRLDAPSGSNCSIRAVRFEDGSEWTAPLEATGPTPLPLNAPLPGASSSPVPSAPQTLSSPGGKIQ